MARRLSLRGQRLAVIAGAGVLLAAAIALILSGLRDSVVFFYPPAELAQKAAPGRKVRLGGLVEAGSVARDAQGALVFAVTDGIAKTRVRYQGDPPDLFRENQGVVAEGKLGPDGVFAADRILAKHDENYMPKEVADALKENGEWRGPAGPAS